MLVRNGYALLLALCLAGSASAQDKAFTTFSPEQVEQILRGLNLEFKKTASTKVEGNFFYDFTLAKKYSTRLHFFKGKDIMVDALFPDHPLETANRWNTRTKFTRAVAHKDQKSPYAALEANLDMAGGVSENAVRRFLLVYQDELGEFDRFLTGKPSVTPIEPDVGPAGDKVFALTGEKLEEILRKIPLTARKQEFKQGGGAYYDYESKNFKIRLTNFQGKDVMIDAVFKKLPLEAINKYNYNRKFIRAVLYTQGTTEYTSLECNLDCSAGISENMLRRFVVTFDEEIQAFVEFINKGN